tara:strand:- start:51 stop:389 length:339 start_codon:yes stop_codon:yes gene_type:complete
MRKLLMVLLLAIPLAGSARMFPTDIPLKSVCFDNIEESLQYHQEILGEYPIGKGWVINPKVPSFAVIMYNPTKPSWTLLVFHQPTESETRVCAILGGSEWEELTPGDDELEI